MTKLIEEHSEIPKPYLLKEDKNENNFGLNMSRRAFDANNETYDILRELNLKLDEDRSDNVHMVIQNMAKNFQGYFGRKGMSLKVYDTQCERYGIIPNSEFNPKSFGYVPQGDPIHHEVNKFWDKPDSLKTLDDALEQISKDKMPKQECYSIYNPKKF